MSYIDGFLVAVPTARLDEYRTYARLGSQVWREHGALDYRAWIYGGFAPLLEE